MGNVFWLDNDCLTRLGYKFSGLFIIMPASMHLA